MKEFITDLLTKTNNSLDTKIENYFKNTMKNAVASQSGITFNGTVSANFNNTSLSLPVGDPIYPTNFNQNLPSFITAYNTTTKEMTFKKGCYLVNAELAISGSFPPDNTQQGIVVVSLMTSNGGILNQMPAYSNYLSVGHSTKSDIIYIHNDDIANITCKLIAAVNTTTTQIEYNVSYQIIPLFYL